MNAKNQAAGLASLGRYGDSTLVHMHPGEVEMLRTLGAATGKEMTYNPHTGLPEAFDLWDGLAMGAGLVAGSFLGPVGTALVSGGASALNTARKGGDLSQSLMSGALSGGGSYGLSSLGQAAVPGADVSAVAQNATSSLGADSSIYPISDGGVSAPASFVPTGGTPVPIQNAAMDGGKPSFFQTAMDKVSGDPTKQFDTSTFMKNAMDSPLKAAMSGGAMLYGSMPPPTQQPVIQPQKAKLLPGFGQPQTRDVTPPDASYRPGVDPEHQWFGPVRTMADGGGVGGLEDKAGHYGYTSNVLHEAQAALAGNHPDPRGAVDRFRSMFGEGALDAIKGASGGGRIRGAGGGLDDLVPGSIEGKQQVRLADGEFVVPADVVSSIGDGSTDQGTRRLDEMLNKVRVQKTGSEKQPGRLKAGTLPR